VAIKVNSEHLDQIRKHGERTYPYECCGFLLGTREGETNVLAEVHAAENERQESRETRYLITPEQSKRADDYARSRGLGLINMDERVRSLGGAFSLQAQPGHGVHIDVRVPVRKRKRRGPETRQ
jgi:hypothetical protein